MRIFLTLTRRELAAYFVSFTGYVIIAAVTLLIGWSFVVLMTNLGMDSVELKAGDKIAQMVPVPILTGPVQEVATLESSARQAKGFGSSG